jgi:cyclophilin family peptidyl-prolyl cis-trans isomerase
MYGAYSAQYRPTGGSGGRRALIVGGAVVAFLLLAAGVTAAVLISEDDGKTPESARSAPAIPAPSSLQPAAGQCVYKPRAAGEGAAKEAGTPPPSAPLAAQAQLRTSLGTISVRLDARAPCTVNSFGYLASRGFYDGTKCHRLTTVASLKVLQCGDPTASGTGGPTYKFETENLAGAKYTRGTVAMARAQETDTNGSQFFIVYGDSPLPPSYTIFGRVTGGLDIVDQVAAAGAPGGDGVPNKPITLEEVRTG